MAYFALTQISGLDKVFLKLDTDFTPVSEASVFKGSRYSYQVVYTGGTEITGTIDASFTLKSDIADFITVRAVECVPSALPVYAHMPQEGYITTEPGLFPDLLSPAPDGRIRLTGGIKKALWITADIPSDAKSGRYSIELSVCANGNTKSVCFYLTVLDAVLPVYPFKYTQWLHADCIADYYRMEVFSEEHWDMTEKFIALAAHMGINMMLTPVFTPPLDTAVGGERTTVQLVDIKKSGGEYRFGFDKLRRWIAICRKHGIEYLEISHLFTQWGANHAPKIVADTEDGTKRIFGWDTELDSGEYISFLASFIPELISVLREEEMDRNTYFHISDEPNEEQLESYLKAKSSVEELLKGFPVLDALSDFAYFEKGICKIPVVGIDHLDPFLKCRPKELWAYYCCGHSIGVSNRFFAMPSARNRIIGAQLYKYDICGFLHWGFNFYNSQLSLRRINPFLISDADMGFPSGDAYSVYPGADGPLASLRAEVFYDALQDLRSFRLLESLTDRETVMSLIEEDGEISLTSYPMEASYLLGLREKVNMEIMKNLK